MKHNSIIIIPRTTLLLFLTAVFVSALFLYPRIFLSLQELLAVSALTQHLFFSLAIAFAAAGITFFIHELLWQHRHHPRKVPFEIKSTLFFLTLAAYSLSQITIDADTLKLVILRSFFLLIITGHILRYKSLYLRKTTASLITLYLFSLVLAAAFSHHPPTSWRWVLDQTLLAGFYVVISNHIATGRHIRNYIINLLILLGSIAAIIGIAQQGGYHIINWQRSFNIFSKYQVARQSISIFGNPNFFGIFMLVSFFLASGRFFSSRRFLERSFIGAALAVTAAGLIFSFSRTAWLSALITLIAGFFLWYRYYRQRSLTRSVIIIVVTLIVTLILVGYYFHPAIAERFNSYSQGGRSFTARQHLYQSAFSLWQERPFFGWGPDTFRYLYRYKIHPNFFTLYPGGIVQYTHNEFLQLLAETGIPGLLSFSLLCGTLLWQRLRAENDASCHSLALAVIAILIAACFSMFMRYLFFGALFWLLLALITDTKLPPATLIRNKWSIGQISILVIALLVFFIIFLQPFWSSAYTRSGLLYTSLHPNTEQASGQEQLFLHALEYNNSNPIALQQLAALAQQQGNVEKYRYFSEELNRFQVSPDE